MERRYLCSHCVAGFAFPTLRDDHEVECARQSGVVRAFFSARGFWPNAWQRNKLAATERPLRPHLVEDPS